MIKLISETIGSDVILFQERAVVGEVRSIIIDAKDGAFLGFFVFDPINKVEKVVPASEIKEFGAGLILISDYNALTDPNDVVRIKKSLEVNPKIIGQRVETQSGQKLGTVEDATINTDLLTLEKLYVTPIQFLGFLTKDLIIPAKKIIEIKKKLL